MVFKRFPVTSSSLLTRAKSIAVLLKVFHCANAKDFINDLDHEGECQRIRRLIEVASKIHTVLGVVDSRDMGLTLPHEHLFYDLRGAARPKDFCIDREDVVKTVLPSLQALKERGVSTLFECSTGGIGRDALILEALARRSGVNVVAPTGLYKESFMPDWVRNRTVDELAGWMIDEIEIGIENTPVKAGFIKLAATDEGLTVLEKKVLRAATRAAKKTGAAIAQHTSGPQSGLILLQEIKVLKEERFNLGKFVWVHAHSEPDLNKHIKAAEAGVNLEYDAIGGNQSYEFFIEIIRRMVAEGHERRILLSQDAGGYNAAEPGGGKPRDLCFIIDHFLPRMEQEGMKNLIPLMTIENPKSVFELHQ